MKKIIVFVLSLLIAVTNISLTVMANESKYYKFNSATYSSNPAQYMANIALAQVGMTKSQLDYHERWCDNFVSDCAIIARQEAAIPQAGTVNDFVSKLLNANAYFVTSPVTGDIAVFSSGEGYSHSGVMIDSTYCVHGNAGSESKVKKTRYVDICSSNGTTVKFLRPSYKVNGGQSSGKTDIRGCLDFAGGGTRTFTVSGWGFDYGNVGLALQVQIYVNGPYDNAEECHLLDANILREDVNGAYPGVGNYHGFRGTFDTYKSGNITLYIYLVNPGVSFIELGVKTVFVDSPNVTIDVNSTIDGGFEAYLAGAGTVDVYIDDVLVANNTNDYVATLPYGTKYRITDIKANNGYKYVGEQTSYSGYLTDTTEIILKYIHEKVLIGDVNNDKRIDAEDLTRLITAVLNDTQYDKVFDVNDDNKINTLDIVQMKKIMSKI